MTHRKAISDDSFQFHQAVKNNLTAVIGILTVTPVTTIRNKD